MLYITRCAEMHWDLHHRRDQKVLDNQHKHGGRKILQYIDCQQSCG